MDHTSVGSFFRINHTDQTVFAWGFLCENFFISLSGFRSGRKGESMSSKNVSMTQRLVLSAMLIAIAAVLSLIKVVDLPYGGSVTPGSMLPLVIIAYRFGTPWGLLCGFVYGIIQLLLGMDNFSYVSGAASVIALALLDYLLAFTGLGLSGLFRRRDSSNQPGAFISGILVVSRIRYLCHVISGATVWAGLSIPTADALRYSVIYNATYMLPEMLVLLIIGYYLSTTFDFGAAQLKLAAKDESLSAGRPMAIAAGLLLAGAGVFDVAAIFGQLQNAETGEFDITGISHAPWLWIAIVSAIALIVAVALLFMRKKIMTKKP